MYKLTIETPWACPQCGEKFDQDEQEYILEVIKDRKEIMHECEGCTEVLVVGISGRSDGHVDIKVG